MIGVDACVVIAFLAGDERPETRAFAELLSADQAVLPPSIVTELLSDPKGGAQTAELIRDLMTLPISEGYWTRAGALRSRIRREDRKAGLGDVLAAQACLDADIPFLTYDPDFRAFASLAGLRLAEA